MLNDILFAVMALAILWLLYATVTFWKDNRAESIDVEEEEDFDEEWDEEDDEEDDDPWLEDDEPSESELVAATLHQEMIVFDKQNERLHTDNGFVYMSTEEFEAADHKARNPHLYETGYWTRQENEQANWILTELRKQTDFKAYADYESVLIDMGHFDLVDLGSVAA